MKHLFEFESWSRVNESSEELSKKLSAYKATLTANPWDAYEEFYYNGYWNYPKIESCTDPRKIAALLVDSVSPLGDREAVAEAAFIAMAKKGAVKESSPLYVGGRKSYFYDQVSDWFNDFIGSSRKFDPYTWVKGKYDWFLTGINTSKVHHKQSIDVSRKKCKSDKFPDPTKIYK